MNRINKLVFETPQLNPLHLPAAALRAESEKVLRDVAFVLALTRRVKEQIVNPRREMSATPLS